MPPNSGREVGAGDAVLLTTPERPALEDKPLNNVASHYYEKFNWRLQWITRTKAGGLWLSALDVTYRILQQNGCLCLHAQNWPQIPQLIIMGRMNYIRVCSHSNVSMNLSIFHLSFMVQVLPLLFTLLALVSMSVECRHSSSSSPICKNVVLRFSSDFIHNPLIMSCALFCTCSSLSQ